MLLNADTMEDPSDVGVANSVIEDESHQPIVLPVIDSSTRPSSVNNGALLQSVTVVAPPNPAGRENIIEDLQVSNFECNPSLFGNLPCFSLLFCQSPLHIDILRGQSMDFRILLQFTA